MIISRPALATVLATTATSTALTWQPGEFDGGQVISDGAPIWASGGEGRRLRFNKGLIAHPIAVKPDKNDDPEALGFPEVVPGKGYLHADCDGGGVFAKKNGQGYYYASNAEDKPEGGVWVIETDSNHKPVDYFNVLKGTKDNCAGGSTPWNTWVSCEEEHPTGYCYQTDPEGLIESQKTEVTAYGGNWEAFAWNDEEYPPKGYTTDDDAPDGGCSNTVCLDGTTQKTGTPNGYCGALDRYTPTEQYITKYWKESVRGESKRNRWNILNDPNAHHDFLKITPGTGNSGTFEWVEDPCDANPELYPKGEGIHIENGILTFSSKTLNNLFFLDLEAMTYETFDLPKEPDNIRGLGTDMYVCTDDDAPNAVLVLDTETNCLSRVIQEDCEEGDFPYATSCNDGYDGTEFAGLDFTPDKMAMYVTVQDRSIWVVKRADGKPFDAPTDARVCLEDSLEGI